MGRRPKGTKCDVDIRDVLLHYFPSWEPPDDRKEWNQCLCPAHEEERPSCAVSYELNAVKCLACGFSGDAIKIIANQEGVSRVEAVRISADISAGGNKRVQAKSKRVRSRRVFGDSGII